MIGHMLDFKKRGSLSACSLTARSLPVPDYGYARPSPLRIGGGRDRALCALRRGRVRRLAESIPIQVLGPAFNTLRKAWKALSKPAKRKGLLNVQFITTPKGGQPMPNHPNKSALDQALERTRAELAHWRRREWNFAGVGAHWDATEDYDDINAETYSYFRRFVDGLRLSNLPDGAHVLDICARTGNGTLYFHQHGKVGSAVCADVSAKMGDICRQHSWKKAA